MKAIPITTGREGSFGGGTHIVNTTPCPLPENTRTMVGSYNCINCKHNARWGQDDPDSRYVHCYSDEEINKEQTK